MKKIAAMLCLLICLATMVSCGSSKDDVLHLGIDAVITEIDDTTKTITVKGSDKKGFLQQECLIDCSETPMIFCNYETHELKDISFDDLQVGDEIILSIQSSEIENFQKDSDTAKLKVEQLQLGTQRMK